MALPTRQTRPAPALGGDSATTSGNWLMLAVLLLGQFMCIIDVLVVNVAMPSIAARLHATPPTRSTADGLDALSIAHHPRPGSRAAHG